MELITKVGLPRKEWPKQRAKGRVWQGDNLP